MLTFPISRFSFFYHDGVVTIPVVPQGTVNAAESPQDSESTQFTDEVVELPTVAQRRQPEKTVSVQAQYTDAVPAVTPRQDTLSHRVQKKVSAPEALKEDTAVDVSVVTQSHGATSWRVQSTVLAPQAPFIDETMDIPFVQQRTSSPTVPDKFIDRLVGNVDDMPVVVQ